MRTFTLGVEPVVHILSFDDPLWAWSPYARWAIFYRCHSAKNAAGIDASRCSAVWRCVNFVSLLKRHHVSLMKRVRLEFLELVARIAAILAIGCGDTNRFMLLGRFLVHRFQLMNASRRFCRDRLRLARVDISGEVAF